MDEFPETEEGWQTFLTELFPEGVILTFCQSTPDMAMKDRSPQVVATGVRVTDYEDEVPEVLWWDVSSGAAIYLRVEDFEKNGEGRYVVKTVNDRYVLISTNLPETDKASVAHWKQAGGV